MKRKKILSGRLLLELNMNLMKNCFFLFYIFRIKKRNLTKQLHLIIFFLPTAKD